MWLLIAGLGVSACSGENAGSTGGVGGAGATSSTTGSVGGAGGAGGAGGGAGVAPAEDLSRDILHTALDVDLATKTGTATITLAPSQGTGASFEAAGLEITAVRGAAGPLNFAVAADAGRLDVGVPASDEPATVIVEYGFKQQKVFEGLMAGGSTLVWPYWCGNLFPCHSDPADGMTFALSVAGAPAGSTTVRPTLVEVDTPSYVLGWATGAYTALDLGTTAAGTHIVAYYKTGGMDAAVKGTAPLRDIFAWYEATYGAYAFGKEAGSVSVTWGPGAYGGMEHHPLWHIADIAMGDPWIHAHEAAHGWYGDGVRVACWEDFVLSEGTVSYLEARSIDAIMGAVEGQKVWDHYKTRLDNAMKGAGSKIAWPDGCGQVDILKSGLFGDIPYMKGAFFFRALEAKIGAQALDKALRAFYEAKKGKAARVTELLDAIKAESGYDPAGCAASWLKAEAVPAEPACP